MRIVARGLFDSVKEPNKSDSCACGCGGVGKRGADPGGREDERAVGTSAVDSMRRIEGGLTTLSIANEMIKTWIPDEMPIRWCLGNDEWGLRVIQALKKRKNRDVKLTIRG